MGFKNAKFMMHKTREEAQKWLDDYDKSELNELIEGKIKKKQKT